MRKRLYRNERATTGGRALAKEAGLIVLNRGSTWRGRPQDVIVNWGASEDHLGEPRECRWINPPDAVAAACDKLITLRKLTEAGVPTLEFTTERDKAIAWGENACTVIVRTMLRASAGRGIVVVEPGQPVPRAPLYTMYFKGSNEYRIHVANGKVIDQQQKRRRLDEDGEQNARNEIRNLENGWVFCREGVAPPECVLSAARGAVHALGLDFGAVDIKANRQGTRCAVLEVNTAPGLEGTSLAVWSKAIKEMIV